MSSQPRYIFFCRQALFCFAPDRCCAKVRIKNMAFHHIISYTKGARAKLSLRPPGHLTNHHPDQHHPPAFFLACVRAYVAVFRFNLFLATVRRPPTIFVRWYFSHSLCVHIICTYQVPCNLSKKKSQDELRVCYLCLFFLSSCLRKGVAGNRG